MLLRPLQSVILADATANSYRKCKITIYSYREISHKRAILHYGRPYKGHLRFANRDCERKRFLAGRRSSLSLSLCLCRRKTRVYFSEDRSCLILSAKCARKSFSSRRNLHPSSRPFERMLRERFTRHRRRGKNRFRGNGAENGEKLR